MTDFPAANAITSATDQGTQKTNFENFLAATKQLPGGKAETQLTIATGAITPTGGSHSIDTESAAASDDLSNIAQTNLPDGSLLLIRAANDARTVVVKHAAGGTGQIFLSDEADFSLNQADKFLLLKRNGASWEEVFRAYGNDLSGYRSYLGVPAQLVGVQDISISQVTVANTVTETTIYSYTVPANTLGTNKLIRTKLFCTYQNNSGGSRTLTIRLKYGTTTVASQVRTLAGPAAAEAMDLDLYIYNFATTAAQKGFLRAIMGSADANGTFQMIANGDASEDSTAAKNLTVTVEHGFAHASLSFVKFAAYSTLEG